MEKSFLSNLSRPNKDEDNNQKINKDMELNSLNLSCIEFNNGNEYYYKNKNYNLGYNQNNFYGNNINNFKGQKNPNLKYNNKFSKNKEYNNNNYIPQRNNKQVDSNNIYNNNSNSNERIINQNCYQINIENLIQQSTMTIKIIFQ